MDKNSLLIGNSDGIGLAMTKRLINAGWNVAGISRRESPVDNSNYTHHVEDVCSETYTTLLNDILHKESFNLCIYFAGIGELLDLEDMSGEAGIIEVNLTGMVKTASAVIPQMVKNGSGHFIGLSSMADELLSGIAPSYHASKAGFSNYLKGLAIALKPKGVNITNIRFGFVDTKMAKGDIRPFMMTVEKAVDYIEHCIRKKPVSCTAPKIMIPLIKFRRFIMKLGAK